MGKAGEALAEVTGQALGTLLQPTPAVQWLASTGPLLARYKQLEDLENAITAFAPDADEAQQILDALTASLKRRYEDHAEDAIRIADEFRAALAEVEPPAECIVARPQP